MTTDTPTAPTTTGPTATTRTSTSPTTTDDIGTDPALDAVPAPDEETSERLHRRLESAAHEDGIVDVAYRTLDTPVGTLLLAATDAGLVRVAFDSEGLDTVLARLAHKVSPRILRMPARLDAVATEIDEYFAGRRQAFDLPLDLQLTAGGFYRSVLGQLQRIDYGRTASYTAVAAAAGNPKAVRAVGSACATNPIPIVVPCHRVLRSDGKVGQYLGGTSVKQQLLDLETAA